MEINHFKGSRPEWLVHRSTFRFWQRARFLRGREGINLLVHACRSNPLSFSFIFLIFPFFLSFFFLNSCFYFLTFKFSVPWCLLLLWFLYTAMASLQCTCQPPLVQLCATPHRQTKENYFVCLSTVAPFLAMVWVPSLSLSLMACTQWF